jgi:hypothetical protein
MLLALLFLLWSAGSLVVYRLVSWMVGATGPPVGSGRLVWVIAIVPLLVVIAGLALTFRALRRVAMPVADVVEAAGRVAMGDYSTRVAEKRPVRSAYPVPGVQHDD